MADEINKEFASYRELFGTEEEKQAFDQLVKRLLSRTIISLVGWRSFRYFPASIAISLWSRYDRGLPSTEISKCAPQSFRSIPHFTSDSKSRVHGKHAPGPVRPIQLL
jgi:hypothetical protein